MTDNFELYRSFMDVPEERPANDDLFYVVELMRRSKDCPDLPAANYHFRNYYIHSKQELDKYEEEIKTLCRVMRLRAYASVNYKSTEQIMMDTCAEFARRIALHDYKKPQAIFESCCGKYAAKDNKRWIVDCDDCDERSPFYKDIKQLIEECASQYNPRIVAEFPTRSGMHLITHPFNVEIFRSACKVGGYDMIDVKFNHLTLLYEDL